jgi:hypothetical protein
MKTRLFLAALCLFLVPLCFTSSSSQFSAYASGYMVTAGGELIPCECDEPGCTGGDCGSSLRTDPNDNQATTSNAPIDSSSEVLLLIAAAMLTWRLRA